MKYKQEYLKLKKQLAEETKERQRYEEIQPFVTNLLLPLI